jgi:hypothetical protein
MQWMLLVWLLIRWQRLTDDRLLLSAGAIIGVGHIRPTPDVAVS